MVDEAAPPLSLGGNLAEFPLADVLTFLNIGMKTGAIEVLSQGSANRLYLMAGEVVYAKSRNPRFQLPSFLVARGLMTETVARDLESRSHAEERPFRDLLLDEGILSAEELTSFEKLLCSEIAFEAMRWREGKFAFLRDRRPEGATTELRISIQNLILEGARREDEASRFEQEAGIDREMVVTLVCATGRLEQQVVLTPVEWGVISLINGKRTLDEIFSLSPAGSESESWSILQRLQSARMIQIHRKGDEPAKSEPGISPSSGEPRMTEDIPIPVFDDRPTIHVPRQGPDLIEKSDVRLISGDDVTTAHGMFGQRIPARLVSSADTEHQGMVFDLVRPILTIGRAESNDIVLPAPSVSKQHAQILQDGEGWLIRDLNSTNGTLINSERITEARLLPGDAVQIGAYSFHFDAVVLPRTV